MFRNRSLVWVLLLAILGISLNGQDATALTTPTALRQSPTSFRQSSISSSRRSGFQLYSTVIERTEEKTVEILKDDKVEEEQKYGGEAYEIRLWNDPFNKREFVARCLTTICGKSDTESYQIMMEAHNNG